MDESEVTVDKLGITEYIPAAKRTESHTSGQVYERISDNAEFRAEMNAAIGVFIEASKALDRVKRYLYYKPKAMEFQPALDGHEMLDSFELLKNDNMSRLFHAILGLCTESGELLEEFDASMYRGEPLDHDKVFGELGDNEWYFAIGCDAMGFDPTAVLGGNIAKLKARFPDKFTTENALNRDIEAENRALKGLS